MNTSQVNFPIQFPSVSSLFIRSVHGRTCRQAAPCEWCLSGCL